MNEKIGESWNRETTEANDTIKKGQEKLEGVKKYVSSNLDQFTEEASLDYQEKTKIKIQEAVSSGNYEEVKKLIEEVEKHKEQFGIDLHQKESDEALKLELEKKLHVYQIDDFSKNGIAMANKDGNKLLFIDRSGNIKGEYAGYGAVGEGVIQVTLEGGERTFVDSDGNRLIKGTFTELRGGSENKITGAKINGNWIDIELKDGKVEVII